MRIPALIALLSLCAAVTGYASPDPGDDFRLTLPTLRKVLPVLYASGRDTCKSPDGTERDPYSWSLAEINGRLDRCEPIKAAMAKAGGARWSPRFWAAEAAVRFAAARDGRTSARHSPR